MLMKPCSGTNYKVRATAALLPRYQHFMAMPPDFHLPAGRVVLRRLRPADLPAFAAYRADPAVVRFQGFDTYTEAQAADFIGQMAEAAVPAAPGEWVQLAIALADNDLLVGDCALHLTAADPQVAEFGITLAPPWQGRGYATAAVRELLGYSFQTLHLRRVLAFADVRNHACVRLLEAAGMRREGCFLENGFYKGEWCDEYQYALLAHEWL